MTESKITITHRLEQEGRWAEASLFKDECISKLRAEGKTRRVAQQAAWEAMASQFPPREEAASPGDSEIISEELPAWSQDEEVCFVRDAMWAYSNLVQPAVQPKDAPSAGAWSLLRWAKQNEDRFFEQMMPKVLAAKHKENVHSDEDPEVSGPYKDNRENTIEALQQIAEDAEKRAIENTCEHVKLSVQKDSRKWQVRFGLNLPADALEYLENQMIGIADEVAQAAARHPEAFQHPYRFEE
jgi:hypothetical protein